MVLRCGLCHIIDCTYNFTFISNHTPKSKMSATASSKKPLRIGVMLEVIQLTDVMGIDIFGNISTAFMDIIKPLSAKAAPLADHAVDMEFLYLATTLEPTGVVPGNNLRFMPTHTIPGCNSSAAPKNSLLVVHFFPSSTPALASQRLPVHVVKHTGVLVHASFMNLSA